MRLLILAAIAVMTVAGGAKAGPARPASAAPEQVSFDSLDGRTRLVGYLFTPASRGRHPAMVLMHGRSGAYSSNAHGDYSAATLRLRDADWARLWAQRGFVVLIVDSFGPRGYPAGFAAGTHADRPAEISEISVRPLDAYGALDWLVTRRDVDRRRVGLMGWSNGASAVLVAMAEPHGSARFQIGVALYPGCGLEGHFAEGYPTSAPVLIYIGGADEEVSPTPCRALSTYSNDVTVVEYPGATHDFDDPANHRQDVAANRSANAQMRDEVFRFVTQDLGR